MIAEIGQIVGVVGVIVSVLILAWQTRGLVQQTKMSNALGILHAHNSSMERHHASWLVIIENPELRPYFYDQKPCAPDDPHRARLLMLAEMVADAAEYGLIATTIVPGSDEFGGWIGYAPFIGNQPIVREIVEKYPEWFPTLAQILGLDKTPSNAPEQTPTPHRAAQPDAVGG